MIVCNLLNASSPFHNGDGVYLAQRRRFGKVRGGTVRLVQIAPTAQDVETHEGHVRHRFPRGRPGPTDPVFRYPTQGGRAAAVRRGERPDVIEVAGPHRIVPTRFCASSSIRRTWPIRARPPPHAAPHARPPHPHPRRNPTFPRTGQDRPTEGPGLR
jgi:hypothetical protein